MKGKNFLIIGISFSMVLIACKSTGLFGNRSPHNKYEEQLKSSGLDTTALGRSWIKAAQNSLLQPANITLPFSEIAYFAAERPEALVYRIPITKGTKILINCNPVKNPGPLYFLDMWLEKDHAKDLVESFSNFKDTIIYEAKKDGYLLLRIQPELLVSMEFDIYINYQPSLRFPVAASGNPSFISFWGASRDAGARSHEGVDIKARFKTPAIAAVDGYARKSNNRLGGKTVFISNARNGYSLYYAHLDSQNVHGGAFVSAGDTIGFIGNTGNAAGTVPHLHFGIYTDSGAINPIAFIQPNEKKPQKIQMPETPGKWGHLKNRIKPETIMATETSILNEDMPVFVAGASGNLLRIYLPGKGYCYTEARSVSTTAIKQLTTENVAIVYNNPSTASVGKDAIPPKTTVEVIGEEGDYLFINASGIHGWIYKP